MAKNKNVKYPDSLIKKMREAIKGGMDTEKGAKKYGLRKEQLRGIVTGSARKDAPGPLTSPEELQARGEDIKQKMSLRKAEDFRCEFRDSDMEFYELLSKHGVKENTAIECLKGNTWLAAGGPRFTSEQILARRQGKIKKTKQDNKAPDSTVSTEAPAPVVGRLPFCVSHKGLGGELALAFPTGGQKGSYTINSLLVPLPSGVDAEEVADALCTMALDWATRPAE